MLRKTMTTLLTAAVLGGLLASEASAARTVRIGDNWFVSASGSHSVSVSRNTVVRWRWTEDNPHNVVARGPERFRSSVKTSGTFSHRMDRRGRYRISCSIHSSMRMTLRVG
jgi:plastocyanin